jgi:Kef-type K+ transport system membrane component KefB
VEVSILLDLALILFATKIFGLLTRRLHLPQVFGALLTGIILGPALLGVLQLNEVIRILADFAVIILLFTVGLETDLNRLRQILKPAVLISFCGVALSILGGFLLAYMFGMTVYESLFVGVILASTAAVITVEALNEIGKFKTKAGITIIGASAIDDIFTIILLSVVVVVPGEGGLSLINIAFTSSMIVLFFVFAVVCGFAAFKLFEFMSNRRGLTRRLSVFGVAFCFFMAYTAERFGLAALFGAYIAGLVLSNSKAEKYIEEKSNILSFLFFSPIFFVSVGLNISLEHIDGRGILFASLFFAAAILTKLVGCGFGARMCKYSWNDSARVGVGMITRCEVAIIAATVAMETGVINRSMFSGIVIAVILTTLTAPVLIKVIFSSGE